MKTYNRETDPSIIEIEKKYIEDSTKQAVDSIKEETNKIESMAVSSNNEKKENNMNEQ